jgi:hypothetical protein
MAFYRLEQFELAFHDSNGPMRWLEDEKVETMSGSFQSDTFIKDEDNETVLLF